MLTEFHISRGSTRISRHWSRPSRHVWAIISYMDTLYTCHDEDSITPSYFITFGDVSCIIWVSTHTCVLYDSFGGVFRVDLAWRGTFIALWRIFSRYEGLVIPWRYLLIIPWAHLRDPSTFWGPSPPFHEVVPLGGASHWYLVCMGGYYVMFWGRLITFPSERWARRESQPPSLWDVPLSWGFYVHMASFDYVLT